MPPSPHDPRTHEPSVEILTASWPVPVAVAAFVMSAGAIAFFGTRLVRTVDRLADATGIGEAFAGAILLGATTSLAGLIVSVLAALDGNASLAVSNSVGGIAAQTAFIVAADVAYRRANLEHAAASVVNLFNAALMLVLLGLVMAASTAPPIALLGIHPVTPLLVAAYAYGLRIAAGIRDAPMWHPRETPETRADEPQEDRREPADRRLWLGFGGLALVVAVAGWAVARSGLSVIAETGLSGTFIGVLFTSVATSIPELVTSIAAVRAGALTLAVSGIIGGNVFDILFIAVADVAYRSGPIYGAVGPSDLFALAWTMVLIAIVAGGLIRRERRGIGFEGVAVLALYVLGLGTIVVMA